MAPSITVNTPQPLSRADLALQPRLLLELDDAFAVEAVAVVAGVSTMVSSFSDDGWLLLLLVLAVAAVAVVVVVAATVVGVCPPTCCSCCHFRNC